MALPLRKFLYRDDVLIDDFLAAIEGGAIESRAIQEGEEASSAGGGRIGIAKTGVEGKKSKTKSTSAASTMAITGPAKFQKLLDYLADASELITIDSDDVSDAAKGDVIFAEGKARLTNLEQVVAAAGGFGQMAQTMEKASGTQIIDEEARRGLQMVGGVGKILEKRPATLLVMPDGATQENVVVMAQRSAFRVALAEIPEDVSLVAKVQRAVAKGDSYDAVDLFGALRQAKPIAAEIEKTLEENPLPDLFVDNVNGPALLVIPIAVYV